LKIIKAEEFPVEAGTAVLLSPITLAFLEGGKKR